MKIRMHCLILLVLPLLLLANPHVQRHRSQSRFIDHHASSMILSRIHKRAEPITEFMADEIAKKSNKLNKRGLIGNIKEQLKSFIDETYTQKAIVKFEPAMREEMDNGFSQYYAIYKRDMLLTPEQEAHRREEFSKWLSDRLKAKFQNHMRAELLSWVDGFRPFSKRSAINVKSNETGMIEKRYFERTGRTDTIILFISGVLLLPVFMNPYMVSIWSLILVVGSSFLFFDPILRRLAYGEWSIL